MNVNVTLTFPWPSNCWDYVYSYTYCSSDQDGSNLGTRHISNILLNNNIISYLISYDKKDDL